MDYKLNFLLMGKSGHGKSATGNLLLGRKEFKTSSNTTSQTKEVGCGFTKFERYTLLVVDGPGLIDTDMKKHEDLEAAAKNMDIALAMCDGGVDAFLFVIKFGNRFTEEEIFALESLKQIFGDGYMDHVIVCLTHGDNFLSAEDVGECNSNIHKWCKQQKNEFGQLYTDCRERLVLFNNREKDERNNQAQIQKLVHLAQGLRSENGQYTSQCFENAARARNKLILEHKAPYLTREIQEKVSLLTEAIDKYSQHPTQGEKVKINTDIKDLMREIDKQDQSFGVLDNMKALVKRLQENLDDVVKLQALMKQFEVIRKAKEIFDVLTPVCTVVGGTICLAAAAAAAAAAPVAVPVAAGGITIGGIFAAASRLTRMVLGYAEDKNQQQQTEIRNKLKK